MKSIHNVYTGFVGCRKKAWEALTGKTFDIYPVISRNNGIDAIRSIGIR